MGHLKLSTKIYLGFASILAILILLGATTVWNFTGIKNQSEMLSTEYVPEVIVANEIERMSLKTMYEARGYGLTQENAYLERAKVNLGQVTKGITDGHELSEKAHNLVKLKGELQNIEKNVTSYTKELNETEKTEHEMEEIMNHQNANAAAFMASAEEFRGNQYEALEGDLNENKGQKKIEERMEKIRLIGDVLVTGYEIRLSYFKSRAERSPKVLTDGVEKFKDIDKNIEELRKITFKKANIDQLNAIAKAGNEYKQGMLTFLAKWEKMQDLNKSRGEAGDAVLESAENLAKAGAAGAQRIAEFATSSVNQGMTLVVIGLICGIVIGAVLSVFITRGITLAMNKVINHLKSSSHEIASASQQLSSAAQDLSSSSNEQASSVEETSSSLEELSGMVENNISNAESALKLSNEVKEVSQTANDTMTKLKTSMMEILQSNEKIEALVKVIANIGEKTQIMDEIVFQTKLLSFNASVEAERAGEHGRGFAVVAQEVGNLAQMSGKAAQEIAQIVKNSITEAEVITNENKSKVNQGNTFVEETAKKLDEIMKAATTVANTANHVVVASKDQAKGIKQINTAMGQVDKATQENAATAEETASSSEELTSQVEVLQRVISDLVVLIEGKTEEILRGAATLSQTKKRNSFTTSAHKATDHSGGKVLKFENHHENPSEEHKVASAPKMAVGSDVSSSGQDDWEKL